MYRNVAQYDQPHRTTFSNFLSSTDSIIAIFRKLREYSGPTERVGKNIKILFHCYSEPKSASHFLIYIKYRFSKAGTFYKQCCVAR